MRNLKKVLALVLALVMAMSLMVTAGATSLGDYKDSASVSPEYATAVDVATQLGVLRGMGDDVYAPQGTLTRAQLATMTYRIATGDVDDVYTANFAGGAAASFTDTPADSWYAGYVGYAADAGYLKGMGDGTYGMTEMLDDGPLHENAVSAVLDDGYRTGDILPSGPHQCSLVGCSEMGRLIIEKLEKVKKG